MSGGAYVRVTTNKTQRRDGEKIERIIMTQGEFSWERFQKRGSLQSLLQRICSVATKNWWNCSLSAGSSDGLGLPSWWTLPQIQLLCCQSLYSSWLLAPMSCFVCSPQMHSMLSKQCHFSQCCRLWWINFLNFLNYCFSGKQWQIYKFGINPNMSANAKP